MGIPGANLGLFEAVRPLGPTQILLCKQAHTLAMLSGERGRKERVLMVIHVLLSAIKHIPNQPGASDNAFSLLERVSMTYFVFCGLDISEYFWLYSKLRSKPLDDRSSHI